MLKRKCAIVVTSFVAVVTVSVCALFVPHVYTTADRDKFYGAGKISLASSVGNQGIDISVRGADIIIEGTIKSLGEKGFRRYTSTNPNVQLPADIGAAVIKYDVKVNDVWFGDYSADSLRLYLVADKMQPRFNDRLVMFLAQETDPDTGETYYRTVNSEQSMYAVNPSDGSLFAFSNEEYSILYDGKLPEVLLLDAEAKLEQFAADERIEDSDSRGMLFKSYRTNHLLKHDTTAK